jgi:limonene-1,2-epoxide hydrolase
VSAENLEVVRRFLVALSSNPERAIAAVEEYFDPDADYYPVRKFPETQPCHGPAEFARFLTRYLDAYSISDWQIRELCAVGDDRVLALTELSTEGSESGLKLGGDLYQGYWLRHGKFLRIEDHLTLRGALHSLGLEGDTLEAAGLREGD